MREGYEDKGGLCMRERCEDKGRADTDGRVFDMGGWMISWSNDIILCTLWWVGV